VGINNIFKPTSGNGSLHQDDDDDDDDDDNNNNNNNGVRIVNFATSKNLVVKSTMFQHGNIFKYTWNSPDGKTQNQMIIY